MTRCKVKNMGFPRIICAFLLLFAILLSAIRPMFAAGGECGTILQVRQADLPSFADDYTRESLLNAVNTSLQLLGRGRGKTFEFCDRKISSADVRHTLASFRDLLQAAKSWDEVRRRVRNEYELWETCGSTGGALLVTGYYEPCFAGSLYRDAEYRYPLYRIPSDLAVMKGGSDFAGVKVGRLDGGTFKPYWTRAEIEENNLLAGSELVYLRDPVEVFILQVQGSGRVRLPDGSQRRVQFAAKNGREYRSIGRLLVDEGRLELAEVTLPSIVAYLKKNPSEVRRVLQHNESYVFFRWGDDASCGPLGCFAAPLTAGRSVALDQQCFPAGALAYLETWKPTPEGWQPMRRFVLNQDTGSAIRGGCRVDFFWGSGSYAEAAAGSMKHPGRMYFLIKKLQENK